MGCAAGFFIEAALDAGFDPIGIELSPTAIELARPEVRARITCGDVNVLLATDPRQFDVVTAFDIIEHTQDPAAFLDDIGRVLASGGLLVVSTPDTGHWLRRVMGDRWPMLQPFQHTFLFSQKAMRALLLEHGYEPLVIESARKVLTVDYLFGQLRQTNPMLSRGLIAQSAPCRQLCGIGRSQSTLARCSRARGSGDERRLAGAARGGACARWDHGRRDRALRGPRRHEGGARDAGPQRVLLPFGGGARRRGAQPSHRSGDRLRLHELRQLASDEEPPADEPIAPLGRCRSCRFTGRRGSPPTADQLRSLGATGRSLGPPRHTVQIA